MQAGMVKETLYLPKSTRLRHYAAGYKGGDRMAAMGVGMRKRFVGGGVTLALALLAGCTFTPEMGGTSEGAGEITLPPPLVAAPAPRLDETGFGEFRFGAPVDLSHPRLERMGEVRHGCAYARLGAESGPLMLMLIDGRLARIDVEPSAGGRSQSLGNGLGLGSSAAAVRAVYGARLVERVKDEVLTYRVSLNDEVGIVFVLYDGVVESYRLGAHEQVQWIEGCS